MIQSTQKFIENVRDIYLVIGKNYTPYLNLESLSENKVNLNDLFRPGQLVEYVQDCKKLDKLAKRIDDKNNLQFTDSFNFTISDQQKAFGTQRMIREVTRKIQQKKELEQPVNIVSLGIGDGATAQKYTKKLSLEKQDQIIGLDLHASYLNKAKQKISQLTPVCFDLNQLSKGLSLPIEDQSADIVECSMVAHHVEDFEQLVTEVARILKKGGSFFYLDLIDRTIKEDKMVFIDDHVYPSFHGVEFFRDHKVITHITNKYFSIYQYDRVGPGILFQAAMKINSVRLENCM